LNKGKKLNSMKSSLVSVIMPAYNAELYIGEAIASVQAQSYSDWELLVINDASTDATTAVVESFAATDSRIRAVTLNHNQGVAAARNKGLELVEGQYLAFLDSDDLWLPQKLERQLKFMQERNCAFSFHSYRHFTDKAVGEKQVWIPEVLEYKSALCGNYIGCLTVCLDRSKVKPFSMPSARHEDYITWLNILKENKICAYGLQEDLARYRISTNGTVSSNKLKSAWWTWLVIRGQGVGFWRSCWCMVGYVRKNLKKWC